MTKITRRDFLRFGFTSAVLAGAGGTLVSCFSPPPEAGRRIPRTVGKPMMIVSTCSLCPAGCGILGEVIDGRVVKITGNPKNPNNQGRLCARGLAGLNTLYDPDRLTFPMRRTGARGEGRWARISWDQAFEEIANRLTALYRSGKTEALWVEMGMPGSQELMALHFFKALGSPAVFQDTEFADPNEALGLSLTWGAESAVSDAAKSRFILNFGANPYESHKQSIYLAQRIVEGRQMNGAKLVTFDVRLSNTAGRSHEWFPAKPGTDGIIALAMAQHILKQGIYDKEFMARWVNVPVAKLMDHLTPYTPEEAEKVSGVKAADIRRLAEAFAQNKPATTISGRGISGHPNGLMNQRCIALLNAVVGNIDAPGGYCLPQTLELDVPKMKGPFSASPQAFVALREGKAYPDLYFCYMANPAYANPNTGETEKILKDEKKVPFLIVADTHLTETGVLADLLLPMASYLESWNLETRPAMNLVPFISLRQPLIQPVAKSMPLNNLLIELTKRIGGDLPKAFPYANSEAFLGKMAGKIAGLGGAGGFELLKKDGVWFDRAAKPAYRSYVKKGFSTPSGKMEIDSKKLRDLGLPSLPVYIPVPDHKDLKDGEFILTVNRPSILTQRLANAKWLAEILHKNPLWINSRTAQAQGFSDGDRVKVTSPAGSIRVRIRLSQGIHPQVLVLTQGLGHTALGKIAQAKQYKGSDFDTELLWWEEDGNGVNPNTIVVSDLNPTTGGISWNSTKVTLTKF